jgi:hypothetical protein
VRQTLSQIREPEKVKLELPIGLIHLDLNGDDKAGEEESLWRIFSAVNDGREIDENAARRFVIALDGGDVHWLAGYTHLLSALPEIALAYDEQELFDHTAHLYFAKPKTPYPYLIDGPRPMDFGVGVDISDAIAFVHLLNHPLKEPQRMESARQHLKSMLDESRKSWDLILKETDDDREWIPNPKQHSVVGQAHVTDEQVRGWQTFLDEADALLDGKKLLPFWRANDGRGVNLKKVFTEPRPFDLVLWVQGTAATPYLEQGELTRGDTWRHLVDLFQGDFVRYAIWFN